jgi:hypothetical protein
VLEALRLEDLLPVYTPATETLGKDEDGELLHCDFNYASVVGMMQYLYSHLCPEIGFALSQLACFTFNPKHSHELVLIHLGQYLKHLLDEGVILRPMKFDEFQMDVYVDSDFMGLYGHERCDDPDNVRSCTWHVIMLNGCPIVWKTQLQESISNSTMMAKNYALSMVMQEVLPLRNLITTVGAGLGLDRLVNTTFQCTAHEDNTGCKTLANLEPGRTTPRSRYYDNKVHWFHSMLSPSIR